MNTIVPILRPWFEFWNKITHEKHFAEVNVVKGEFHSKVLRAEAE